MRQETNKMTHKDFNESFNTLNEIHSKLVIAQTFTDIKDQKGCEALKEAMQMLYEFLKREYKQEWEAREVDPFI